MNNISNNLKNIDEKQCLHDQCTKCKGTGRDKLN